jgi:4-amino-4-deoxy-L-arabinose transferase-like glycosyltransferase
LPLVEAWTFAWAGSADDWTTGIASLFFYVSLLGICYGACRTRMNVTAALFVALAVALLTPLSGLAIAVMTDLPLAALAAIAALWVVRWLETRERGALFIAALATGLLPWTKREGVLLLAALCLALLIVNRRARAAWLAAGAMALAALLLSGPWWLFMLFNGVRNVAFAPFTLANLQLNLWRLPHIAWLELLRLISADWNWLWPVAALMALAASVTRHQRADIWPLVALVYLGAMSFAYVFSDFVPFQQHVVSSVDRLLAHVAPLLVLWIAYRCPVAHRLNDHSK